MVRDIDMMALVSSKNKNEEKFKEILCSLISGYGLVCNSVFFAAVIPPPQVTIELEKLACASMAEIAQTERLRRLNEIKQDVAQKQNQFALNRTKEILRGYSEAVQLLKPHFVCEESERAARALADTNFFWPLQQAQEQLKRTGNFTEEEKSSE
eukprot:CAMPEP_0116997536 /NCGR_PEP_ID=MMETSP0472-20121206/941_1 /TAXON_ID=693140 ORGANISM="Tiarina fusus, Strain LIS" /NCGR_SAMPLE_ID=MMETSP0472 /ASSEMBLY_ACC=CAM_ASM_000603 /LENGTH=153 /DNA_ID=CAMNT_0004696453 /DNA_START=509 /DNA_END=970 /DNA_ORIENTATION=+